MNRPNPKDFFKQLRETAKEEAKTGKKADPTPEEKRSPDRPDRRESDRRTAGGGRYGRPEAKTERSFKPGRGGHSAKPSEDSPGGRNDRNRHRPGGRAATAQGNSNFKPIVRPQSELAAEAKTLHSSELIRTLGVVDKSKNGTVFIIFDSNKVEDLRLPEAYGRDLFFGDRVEVVTDGKNDRVVSISVVKRRFERLIGRFHWSSNRKEPKPLLVFQRRRIQESVVLEDAPKDLEPGEWIQAELKGEAGEYPKGHYLERFGDHVPPEKDLDWISGEYGIHEFPTQEAIEEANAMGSELKDESIESLLEGREDWREIPLFTIDGEDARDFDDAIWCEPSPKNPKLLTLYVSIADVSHYVKVGTKLDDSARERGTSVYFPERAFHMLPRNLSENLCSLVPNVPRLALSVKIEIDETGNFVSTQMFETLIHSHRRATYNEIYEEYVANKNNPSWKYSSIIKAYEILRRKRQERGSLDFDFPEAKIKVDETGMPTGIEIRERNDAHRLIEEFMIAANEAVTEWMLRRKRPFVYRVHESPSAIGLTKWKQLARSMGVTLRFPAENPTPKELQLALGHIKGHPAENVLQFGMLRSLKQARYSAEHDIHFGLASEAYTHFTSPIRRYPDLIVHRLLRAEIRQEKAPHTQSELTAMSEHCSYRERLASEAERESIRIKQIRIAETMLGEVCEGVVNSCNERGIMVQLKDPYLEGFLPAETGLHGDHFQFREDRLEWVGRTSRTTLKSGTLIRVQIARADFDSRSIEFDLFELPARTSESVHNLIEDDAPSSETRRERTDRNGGGGKAGRDRQGNGDKKSGGAKKDFRPKSGKTGKSNDNRSEKGSGKGPAKKNVVDSKKHRNPKGR